MSEEGNVREVMKDKYDSAVQTGSRGASSSPFGTLVRTGKRHLFQDHLFPSVGKLL